MDDYFRFWVVLFHGGFGLFKRSSRTAKDVDHSSTSLSIGNGDFSSNALASSGNNYGSPSLRKFRTVWTDGGIGIVVPFGDWSGIWWLHCGEI
jgi:hypothetical protein